MPLLFPVRDDEKFQTLRDTEEALKTALGYQGELPGRNDI